MNEKNIIFTLTFTIVTLNVLYSIIISNQMRTNSNLVRLIIETNASTLFNIEPKSEKPTIKLILIWTKYFHQKYEFNFATCPRSESTNCVLTDDRDLLKSSQFVLFHMRDMHSNDMPAEKPDGQRWIVWSLESPSNSGTRSSLLKNGHQIDFVLSYRSDSDIYVPYGKLIKLTSNEKSNLTPYKNELFKYKTKTAAWMVSDCLTGSRREHLARQMSHFMDIDIYGSCGTYSCPRSLGVKCYEKFEKQYKFYLSFENSLCPDYVTEKFYRSLNFSMIPIVFGDSHYYRSVLSHNAYIDARNFSTVEELAKFVNRVGNDEELYRSYFVWKDHYRLDTYMSPMCNLCSALNNRTVTDSVISGSRNLDRWWVRNPYCKRGSYFLLDDKIP